MYVCLCRQVTDRCVHAAIAAGARDAESLGRMCRAGTGCGGCRATVEAMLLAAEMADQAQPYVQERAAS
jgi:bacterioferritin-associated ferredoxin